MKNLISDLFTSLNAHCSYALLRNKDSVLDTTCRDIDIIIDISDYENFTPILIEIIERNSFKIISLDRRAYMHYWGIGRVVGNEIEVISFDFIFNIQIKDTVIFNTDNILKNRELFEFIYCVRADDEFATKYFYNLLLGEKYPEKYYKLKDYVLANYSSHITEYINSLWGDNYQSLDDLEKADSKHLLKLVRSKKTVYDRSNYVTRRVTHLLCYIKKWVRPSGFTVSFSGYEGVEKTALINLLDKKFSCITSVNSFNHRPNLIGDIEATKAMDKINNRIAKDSLKQRISNIHCYINSMFKLLYYTFDYIIGYLTKTRSKITHGGIVIFDKYYNDLIIDKAKYSIFLSDNFLSKWGQLLIPNLKYNFLITADIDIVLHRKHKINSNRLKSNMNDLDYLCMNDKYISIINNNSAEIIAAQIATILLKKQHLHNINRLKDLNS